MTEEFPIIPIEERLILAIPGTCGPAIGDTGGYVLLQEVAGGSFAAMCQMAELESPREIIAAFNAVLHGLICKWNRKHLRGLTHGDLHTGNILLPRMGQGELLPQRFRLVDLTTFDISAPLTRDPAMLLLSIVAGRVPLDARAQEELVDQIVRGEGRHDLFAPLTRAVRDVDAKLITDDFREDWINQLPLSLLAAALLHCTFGNLDERTRWWFFRLAARCGAEYLRSTDSWPSSNHRPSVLGLEDMGGFHMSPRP
ncbi:hypothetical protein GCM10022224_103020 [Nonomuraea antimicrobica]|uniref:Phosphotransferase enzyme family protein n=1 Tax=Nonomuraea antimicrobica TaxID=561173 RepID=A0ABP7EL21_9ACTN